MKRIALTLTNEEYEEIKKTAEHDGLKIATFCKMTAIKEVRRNERKTKSK